MSYAIRTDYRATHSAAWYDRQYRTSLRAQLANWGEQRAFGHLLAHAPPGGTVLDVACGTGRFLGPLLERGYQVSGIDVSPEMLAHARAQVGAQAGLISLQEGDAEHLPFDAGAFDGVTCIRLYQRVPAASRAKMLREVRRVGRGWAILFFGVSTPWLDLRRAVRTRLARRPNVRYPVTLAQLVGELRAADMLLQEQAWAIPYIAEGLFVRVTW
jgi:ubiquinone/menaquinone biosynthesis C-methylase UbiE